MPEFLLALAFSVAAAAGPLELPRGPYRAVVEPAGPGELTVRFPSPARSPFRVNDTVWGHFLLPEGRGPFPAILVLPVMAAPNVWIERHFIDRFRRDGFAVLWLEMPYQFHRRPSALIPSGEVFLARTPQRLAFNFRQSALDARRGLDWLAHQERVDPARIGIFGISLGALVSSVVYAVDPRPRYAVFLLGGADFPSLVLASSLTGPIARKLGIRPAELSQAWRGLEPADYLPANASKPALLINASWDTVIPSANAASLRAAFPAARQIWVPLGHYTSLLHLFWVPGYVSGDFRAHLPPASP